MDFHPYANIFPMMSADEMKELRADMRENGYRTDQPIIIYEDKILDGRNRYAAALAESIEPVYDNFNGRGNPLTYVIRMNIHRRHLSSGQQAAIALDLEAIYAEKARERQQGGQGGILLSELFPKANEFIHAAEQAAEVLNTNAHYITDAKNLKENAPALFEQVKAGIMTIPQAKKVIRRQDIQDQQNAINRGEVSHLPPGMFEVIAIDPPWPYGTKYDAEGRRAANPYPEMSIDEITELLLPASPDCIVWLWTTHKFLRLSFGILDQWGFRDVAILTWEKDRMGLGSWLRSNSEFCIMAVRGYPVVNLTNQTTILHGPMRQHSRKPDEFYSMVDSLCVGRKLDYFSREERAGWETFGNESEKFNGME